MTSRRPLEARAAMVALAVGFFLPCPPAAAQLEGFFDNDEEEDRGPLDIGGNVKTFSVLSVPYEHLLMPQDPGVSGAIAGRLIFRFDGGQYVQAEIHPLIVATTGQGVGGGGLTQLGVGARRPEALDLSLEVFQSGLGGATALIDRGFVRFKIPHLDITVGRQPVAFGTGFFFTPMDIISPFSPATLDREYKPGVDAIRADAYFGTSGQVSVLAAYHGAWNINGIVFAGHARYNLEGIDYGLFVSQGHLSSVVGLDLAGDILGVGWRAEATGTLPYNDKPFVRAVFGTDIRYDTISVTGEVYVQTLGSDSPRDYLSLFQTRRFARGELWLAGQYYAAVSASWQFNPLLTPAVAIIANVGDASVLMSPSLNWSVSDEVDVSFGAQISQGARPDDVLPQQLINPDGSPKTPAQTQALFRPNSEFGIYPYVGFAQLKAAF